MSTRDRSISGSELEERESEKLQSTCDFAIFRVRRRVEAANAAARNGTLGSTIQRILGDLKPEAAYFAEENGQRTGFIFFDMRIPDIRSS